MYVTANFLDIGRGKVKYLFFLLTEDYLQNTEALQSSLSPLLAKFGRDLGSAGAIVKPSRSTASKNFERVVNTGSSDGFEWSLHGMTPALLIIENSLQEFKPGETEHVIISLRDAMDEYGHLKIFEVDDLLSTLAKAAHEGTVFKHAREHLKKQDKDYARKELSDAITLKPNFMGIGLDLKQFISAFKEKRRKSQSSPQLPT